MSLSAHDTYVETQVATATPQRLRLMLIEEALRQARSARDSWNGNQLAEGSSRAVRCREIISELIAGIHPDQTPLAKRILGLYLFLFSSLTELQLTRDTHQLAGVIRVLEEECQTWQDVCRQLPERQVADPSMGAARDELAPRRVDDTHPPSYIPALAAAVPSAASAFSIDA